MLKFKTLLPLFNTDVAGNKTYLFMEINSAFPNWRNI